MKSRFENNMRILRGFMVDLYRRNGAWRLLFLFVVSNTIGAVAMGSAQLMVSCVAGLLLGAAAASMLLPGPAAEKTVEAEPEPSGTQTDTM